MSTWADRFDRLARVVSPRWAAQRAIYRNMEREALGVAWRDSKRTRIDSLRGRYGRQDTLLELGQERIEVYQRAREAERTNVIAESLLSRSGEQAVGEGMRLKCHSGSPKWNEFVQREWQEWADHEADVRGLSTLDELDVLKFRSYQRDGDAGTIFLADEKVQLFESDQLASPSNILDRNMVDGVELDRRGRPLQFWIVENPDPLNASVRHQGTTAVPAEWVSYMARRQRLGQTRGLSTFAGSLWLLDQIDGNISAMTTAARMAACLGLVIKRKVPRRNHNEPTETGPDGTVRRKMRLSPGGFIEVGSDDDVHTLTPNQPKGDAPAFLAALCRFAGLGFGLPIELFLFDFTRSNYSQARGALLQAAKVTRKHQLVVKRDKSRTFHWWLINRMRSGRIPYRAKALRHSWTPPRRELLDAEKELKSAMAEVDAGLNTLAEVAASMGRDFGEVLEQRQAEIEEMNERGIPIVRSTMTRDPGGAALETIDEEPAEEPAPAPGGDDQDDDEEDEAAKAA